MLDISFLDLSLELLIWDYSRISKGRMKYRLAANIGRWRQHSSTPSKWHFFLFQGEYKVEVKVSSNGVEVGCSEIDLEIAKVT